MAVILTAVALALPMVNHSDSRWKVVRPYNAKLERIAVCESHPGGRPRWYLNTGNGFYGGFQFMLSTWRSVGGKGLPSENSVLEQKYRAVKLIKQQGYSPWPKCGYA